MAGQLTNSRQQWSWRYVSVAVEAEGLIDCTDLCTPHICLLYMLFQIFTDEYCRHNTSTSTPIEQDLPTPAYTANNTNIVNRRLLVPLLDDVVGKACFGRKFFCQMQRISLRFGSDGTIKNHRKALLFKTNFSPPGSKQLPSRHT